MMVRDGEVKRGTHNPVTKLRMDRRETPDQGQGFESDSSVAYAPNWRVLASDQITNHALERDKA